MHADASAGAGSVMIVSSPVWNIGIRHGVDSWTSCMYSRFLLWALLLVLAPQRIVHRSFLHLRVFQDTTCAVFVYFVCLLH